MRFESSNVKSLSSDELVHVVSARFSLLFPDSFTPLQDSLQEFPADVAAPAAAPGLLPCP